MVTWSVVLVVLVAATVQSLFGVGLLLFGTPLLLLLDYEFAVALATLLPVSLAVNGLQVRRDYDRVDRELARGVLLFAVPVVIVCLAAVVRRSLDVAALMGAVLLLGAAKDLFPPVQAAVLKWTRLRRANYVSLGIVHGLTNLGGSLLTALVHARGYEKETARATTAACYATLALVQVGTLAATERGWPTPLHVTALYVLIGLCVFLLVDGSVFRRIAPTPYRSLFTSFLVVSGSALLMKGMAS